MFRVAFAAALATVVFLTAALLTAGAGAGPGERPERPPVVAHPKAAAPHAQPLVVLHGDHVVRRAPDGHARRIGFVAGRRPLTHVRTALPVLGRATSKAGGAWVHVRLPGRPNGHAGWISADATRRSGTRWSIAIRLSKRLVYVTHRGRVEGRFRAVVGKSGTPTPAGHFFVEEGLRLRSVGGPYALAVSARSTVFQQFGGGPGQVALHGVTGIPGVLGTAVSHGCVRLSRRAMRWLSRRIGPGVPLLVKR